MANTVEHGGTDLIRRFRDATTTVAVASNTTLAEVPLSDQKYLGFHVSNDGGTNAFDAFAVLFKFHADGDYVTVANAESSWTTPDHPVLGASSDITVLAHSSSAWAVLDVRGVVAVKFTASAAANTTTATIEGGAY